MYHGRPTGSSLMKPQIFRDYPPLCQLIEWATDWQIWWFLHHEYCGQAWGCEMCCAPKLLGPGWSDKAIPEARPGCRGRVRRRGHPIFLCIMSEEGCENGMGDWVPKHKAGEDTVIISEPWVGTGQLFIWRQSDAGSYSHRLGCTEGSTLYTLP